MDGQTDRQINGQTDYRIAMSAVADACAIKITTFDTAYCISTP